MLNKLVVVGEMSDAGDVNRYLLEVSMFRRDRLERVGNPFAVQRSTTEHNFFEFRQFGEVDRDTLIIYREFPGK